MLTGVFLLQDLVTRGEIKCGMVVSGDYISHLSWNAAKQVRSVLNSSHRSRWVTRVPLSSWNGRPMAPGIHVIGFTTLAEHSRLCLAFPSTVGPGAQMYTEARKLQKVAIEDMAPLVADVLGEAGIELSDIDYLIPHQTSAWAIRKGTEEFAGASVPGRSTVVTLEIREHVVDDVVRCPAQVSAGGATAEGRPGDAAVNRLRRRDRHGHIHHRHSGGTLWAHALMPLVR